MKTGVTLLLALAPLTLAAGCGSGVFEGAGGAGGNSSSSSSTTASSSATSSTSATTSATTTSTSSGGPPPMPTGCVTDVSAGHHAFPCDGSITYDVEIPAACAMGGCGLVLDMHGLTMNAAQEDSGTGMRALGQKNGYVVVQPNAPGVPPSWDQVTHIPLVFAFVQQIAQALVTDPKRAHVMGFSQGGGMTWRMICSHADYWASAAPLSGIEGCEFIAPNVPSREVPTLMVHGHKDNIVSFAGIAVPQRDAALAYWKDGMGTKFGGDTTFTSTRYTTSAGTPFDFWEHDYVAGSAILGGHCFPGGTDVGISPFQFGCDPPDGFVVGETVMAFFLAHPMTP